ncbi:hypothetical protein [Arsukibacterium sp.]|uniref:hypothetical protein n=1 Tax=Arsukibacterium sp. TaxID=1977258 RepID=UPI002FDB2387
MDISRTTFYYFSADLNLPGLPTECEFIKKLANNQGREALLIRCKNRVKEFGDGYIVIVPRQIQDSLLDPSSSDEVVFVYAYGAQTVSGDKVGLDGISPIDIGGIAIDKDVLRQWC